MSRSRIVALITTCALMSPAAAFAQGAGDDQYQDPLPDGPTTEQPQDGLDDAPPGGGGSGGGSGGGGGSAGAASAGGSGGGSAGGSGSDGSAGQAGASGQAAGAQATSAGGRTLPNTGSEPLLLAFAGLVSLLIGVGLRLRTIDPDAY